MARPYPAVCIMNIEATTAPEKIEGFLQSLGWVEQERIETVSIAGEGNMNVVLRVTTDARSFILKQSRPFVRKYPQLPAPLDRIDTEYQFYQTLRGDSLGEHFPAILGYAPEHHLLMLQDLGQLEDMTRIYRDRGLKLDDVELLVSLMKHIHRQSAPTNYPTNFDLRQLNHQHIFVLPFLKDNGFQLDDVQPGLQELSLPIKENAALKTRVTKLGERYLSRGDYLIHGDYYPGSWMQVEGNLFVIDPEFSFVGFREFDMGVMVAHLMMASLEEACLYLVCEAYEELIDETTVRQIAGIEIMRRLIGLAQLPLERTLEEKSQLLEMATHLVMD